MKSIYKLAKSHAIKTSMALVVLVSIAACSEEKTIASIEMTETNTIEADNTGSNTSKPKALDNGSHSDPVANTDDETHFSLLSLSNVDVADALTIFVAERQEIAETNNDSSLSTEGKGLFKIEQNGDVTEVNFLNEQGEPFDDTVAPSKMVQGNGYIVMGFIISGENEDGQPTTPTFETVIVRQSDGAAYYIGDDRTLYPGTYQYGLNGARGPINPIATTQSNDVFYSGIDGRLIQITGLGDSSGENIERQFVGPESFTSDVPKVNYNDNLVVMDGAVFLPNLDGSYRISDADLSMGETASYRVLPSLKQLYVLYSGTWYVDPETNLPRLQWDIDPETNLPRIQSNSSDLTIFKLSIDSSTNDVIATLYGTLNNMEGGLTATDTFGNTGSGELYSLGGKIFLVSKNSGIIELENDTNTPKLVSNTTVRKLFVTEKYMFIQNQDDELLRFSEDTSLEPVAGQDKYRNLSFFQDATGEVLVKGVDISTSSDIVGRIRPEQNDIELIESLPFDAEVTELIKLN